MRFIVAGMGLALTLAVAPIAFAQQPPPTYPTSNGSAKIEPTYHPNNSSAMAQAQSYHESNGSSAPTNGAASLPSHESNGAAAKKKPIQNQ